ncbi:MAG: rod shape-determining protein MreC [Bacilli bacterium]|jgi:rod shape-determining protein MreC
MRLYKRHSKLEKRNFIIIILLIITIIIALFFYTINDKRELNIIEKTFKDGYSFLEKIFYLPLIKIGDYFDHAFTIKSFYQDYQKDQTARDQNKLLKEENKELKKEINSLKKLLEIDISHALYQPIRATVIQRDVGYWYNILTVDKGQKEGIKSDMPVISEGGLIGIVIRTTNHTSDVKLITTNDLNRQISVAVVNQDDEITYGLIAGYHSETKHLLIENIIDEIKIEKGDKVITSGLSNLFPRGILIGKVEKESKDHFGISKQLFVKSEVNFTDIRFVQILKREGSENEDY